jgi:hypothetical protein
VRGGAGCRSPEEVVSHADDLAVEIPASVWDELRAEGLLGPRA